jgi:hypothetical protein
VARNTDLYSRYGSEKEGYIILTNSCNLTPQTVMLFVPKSPSVRYAVELGVRCTGREAYSS